MLGIHLFCRNYKAKRSLVLVNKSAISCDNRRTIQVEVQEKMPAVTKNAVVGQVSYSLVKAVAHSERQHATTAAEKFTCKSDTSFSLVYVVDVVR